MDPNRMMLHFGPGNPGLARMGLPVVSAASHHLFAPHPAQMQLPLQFQQMPRLSTSISPAGAPFPPLVTMASSNTPMTMLLQPAVQHTAPVQPRPMIISPAVSAALQAAAENEASSAKDIPSPQQSSSTSSKPIWSEHKAPDSGRVYYYNRMTKQSSWTKPDELKTAEERLLLQSPWKEYKTAEGRVYYHNSQTKQTTWTAPEELTTLKIDEKTSNNVEGAREREDEEEEEGINVGGESDLEKAMQATLETFEADEKNKKEQEEREGLGADSAAAAAVDEVSDTEHQRELRRRQCEVFRELLRDKYNGGRITSTSSWEHTVKFLQFDPRFRILNKVSEKKQIFNAWKTQRQKEERDEKRLAIKKAKEELEKWLQSNERMTARVRYSKAHEWFSGDMEWKSVADDDRREIFRDVQASMAKRQNEAAKSIRRKNIKALADILEGMDAISYRTTWAQAQRLLVENASFAADKTLQNMDKEDALIVFEEHIRALENEENKEKELENKRLMRHRRKNREAFQQFLREMHKRSQLTSISLWCELYPVISADQRFHNMLPQPGSTPLDLFKFYVEDLKAQYGEDRRIIKSVMKDRNLAVETSTKFEEFQKWMAADERAKSVDIGNMKLCYNSLVDKAEIREKEREKEDQRKKRRLESGFRSLLKQILPPVEPETKWEDVRVKIDEEQAFLAIHDEQERMKIFADYTRTLAEACGHHHSVPSKKKKDKKKHRVRTTDAASSIESEPEAGELRPDNKRVKKKRKKEKEAAVQSAVIVAAKNGQKLKRKKKRRKPSVSEDDTGELDSDGNLSEKELERKRKELLKQLNAS